MLNLRSRDVTDRVGRLELVDLGVLRGTDSRSTLISLGIILFSVVVVVLWLVTLPVEFDASNR
jgi:Zn-dependent membrane protease YugP